MDIAELLAQNIALTHFEDLPQDTIEITKRSILDSLGVMVAASTLGEGCREVIEIALSAGGKEESSVIGFRQKIPCYMAAFSNGALAHALDYDDVADAAKVHPTASTLPAALAVAERESKSGKDLITAVALGNDLVIRLGLALPKSMSYYGWLLPQVLGTFGAAAAAAKLLNLDAEDILYALGHALSQTAGSLQPSLETGSVSRGLYQAFTGKVGVISSLLAQKGLAGVRNIFQGKSGLFNLYFKGDYNPEPLTAELGKRFQGTYVSFKPWPSCRGSHTYINAARNLVQEHNIKPDDVEQIVLGIVNRDIADEEKRKKPISVIDAKFSLAFTTAMVIARQNLSLADFTSNGIQDKIILGLSQKVSFKFKPELSSTGISPGEVEIHCRNKQTFSQKVDFAYGHPRNPVSLRDLIIKFEDCSTHSLQPITKTVLEESIDRIINLDKISDIGKITELLN